MESDTRKVHATATTISRSMRESPDEVKVIGNFNSEDKFKLADKGTETSVLLTTGRGYFIIGILGARQEPTNHAMRDIAAVKKDLETWFLLVRIWNIRTLQTNA